jgi:hypothetical protein
MPTFVNDGSSGVGVHGASTSNTGVFGHSASGIGVDGNSESHIGVVGRGPVAGRFEGPVEVLGTLSAPGNCVAHGLRRELEYLL